MKLTKEQIAEFEVAARPLIEFINKHGHPHCFVTVDTIRAEFFEGIANISVYDYIPH